MTKRGARWENRELEDIFICANVVFQPLPPGRLAAGPPCSCAYYKEMFEVVDSHKVHLVAC